MAHDWMNDEYWTRKIGPVNEWIAKHEGNPDLEDEVEIISMQVKRGNRSPEKREKVWHGLLLEFRVIDDAPIGGPGPGSSFPVEVQQVLNDLQADMEIGFAAAFNDAVELSTFRSHTVDGIKVWSRYANAEDYGTHMAKTRTAALKRMFKEEYWDGTMTGLYELSVIEFADD